jgi:histidyl-tRNA synthetase
MDEQKVKPVLPGGFRDYLPDQQIRRDAIIRRIRDVYERFGFDPLETACIERTDVLTGGRDDLDKIIYRSYPARGGRGGPDPDTPSVALRFDLTVPLARVVAANPNLPRPFKRYQLGIVWRGEKPQLGRYREFLQLDADIVGASSMMADAEMVALMDAVLRELGFERFRIRLNNRKILNGLAVRGGFADPPERVQTVIRTLDKIDTLGVDGVLAALGAPEPSDSTEPVPALTAAQVDLVREYLAIQGSNDEVVARLASLLSSVPIGAEGARELNEIVAHLAAAGVASDVVRVDPKVARGLDYYTGPIWEAVLLDALEIGSIYGGGRYDGLVGRFMPDAMVPCTGTSVGVDRLFAAMETLGMLEAAPTITEVLVVSFSPELAADYQRLAAALRSAGLRTAIYLGDDTSFRAQLAYAARQGVPVVVIYGPDDRSAGVVQVRDMRARAQQGVPFDHVATHVRSMLRKAGT